VLGPQDFFTALRLEMAEWETSRNRNQKGADWQFKTDDARIKLKQLYPQFKRDSVLAVVCELNIWHKKGC
jgi:hypothetical protein